MSPLSLSLVVLLALGVFPLQAWDAVVAIRYYRMKGKSHGALFLFTGDGKLVRQLSDPGPHQDGRPVFSPDGKQILFTRRLANGGGDKLFLIDRKGGKPRALNGEPPNWYASRKIGTPFSDDANEPDVPAAAASETEKPALSEAEPLQNALAEGTLVYPSPDGSLALITKRNPEDDDHPLAFLQKGKGAKLLPLAEMPGYSVFWFPVLHKGSPFLVLPHLKAAFFTGEHDSTLGTTYYALDVDRNRILKLSDNGASVVPWPGHSGFFSVANSRYEELGDGRTVNCSYLDWYDAELKHVRFGHSLGIFYGATIFLPGKGAFTLPEPEIGN